MAHQRSERAKLEQQRERLLAKIATVNPGWVMELRGIDMQLAMLETPESQRYAAMRNPKPATEAVLERNGRWMTGPAIALELQEGGYPMHPESGIRLMLQAIRTNAARGHLQRNGDYFGLLAWGDSPDYHPPKK